MKAHLITAIVVSVQVTLVSIIAYIVIGYDLVCDTDAWIDRAQVAADREDMHEYLTKLKSNLEERSMTSGHFRLIFKHAGNDLALNYKAVDRLLERLDSIKDIPKKETAYQVALNDIRGTIRELPNPAIGYLWARYWFLWPLAVSIWAWPITVVYRNQDLIFD